MVHPYWVIGQKIRLMIHVGLDGPRSCIWDSGYGNDYHHCAGLRGIKLLILYYTCYLCSLLTAGKRILSIIIDL